VDRANAPPAMISMRITLGSNTGSSSTSTGPPHMDPAPTAVVTQGGAVHGPIRAVLVHHTYLCLFSFFADKELLEHGAGRGMGQSALGPQRVRLWAHTEPVSAVPAPSFPVASVPALPAWRS